MAIEFRIEDTPWAEEYEKFKRLEKHILEDATYPAEREEYEVQLKFWRDLHNQMLYAKKNGFASSFTEAFLESSELPFTDDTKLIIAKHLFEEGIGYEIVAEVLEWSTEKVCELERQYKQEHPKD